MKFQIIESSFEFSFWEKFYDLKLNKLGLNQEKIEINGRIQSNKVLFTHSSFENSSNNVSDDNTIGNMILRGELLNVNTLDEFVKVDKRGLIGDIGRRTWRHLLSGKWKEDEDLSFLSSFLLLSYADLKSFRFTYWCAFPALVMTPPASVVQELNAKDIFTDDNVVDIRQYASNVSYSNALFAVVKSGDQLVSLSLRDSIPHRNQTNLYFAIETSSIEYFPWILRNYLALLYIENCGYTEEEPSCCYVNILALLPNETRLLKVKLSQESFDIPRETVEEIKLLSQTNPTDFNDFALQSCPKVVGWEPNERGKPGPRSSDASSVLDSRKLMEQAVDLNIRLMKWRMWTSLDIEKIAQTKCLLFGAGTLGCEVARGLIGWGFRHITFVDSGKVSFSNPVRQSLYEFEDSVQGKPKAISAAEKLQKIFPGVMSKGYVVKIPMPGHPIEQAEEREFSESYNLIDQLVRDHDVVFELTDSREARWLPTVLASRYNKIVINAALGFDSYLVMRHGVSVLEPTHDSNKRLGCYFCMDITAPGNSQKDRTLDQQCTVTRPGLAQIASGLSVELLVGLLNHPHGNHAPIDNNEDDSISPLPHQIRGSVHTYFQMLPTNEHFTCCTACSLPIVQALIKDGVDFVRVACNSPAIFLEKISGAHKFQSFNYENKLVEVQIENDEDDW